MENGFSSRLAENAKILKDAFRGDDAFVLRMLRMKDGAACFIAYFDGMVDAKSVDLAIVQPVQACRNGKDLTRIMERVVGTEQVRRTEKREDVLLALEAGDTALAVDGFDALLICSAKGFPLRAVEEPDTEKYLRGPKEGFTESLTVNTTLLRRRLLSPELKMEFYNPVEGSGTRFALCYLENVMDKALLARIRDRLSSVGHIPALQSSNHLEERLGKRWQLFKTVGVTEKPDIAAAKLLEGRCVIICDGSPNVLTAPFLFLEYFQSGGDYYGNFWFGSVMRILRMVGALLSVITPAVYISFVCFHQQLLPTELLLSMAAAREGVPLSSAFETFLLLIAFELLREAGIMMPQGIGNALSTVGGVVIGQAAVDARFISAPLVIVIAFTGLTDLMIPKMKGPIFFMRLYLLVLASMLGLFGCAAGIVSIFAVLAARRSFGFAYTAHLDAPRPENWKDSVLRAPMWMLHPAKR